MPYKPEVAVLHIPDTSNLEVVLRSAGIPEPHNVHSFIVDPTVRFEDTPAETRTKLERTLEAFPLSHLLIQDRLMDPVAGMARLVIGYVSWYSPTQEGFTFGVFDDDANVSWLSLDEARERAQFIEIPDFSALYMGQN